LGVQGRVDVREQVLDGFDASGQADERLRGGFACPAGAAFPGGLDAAEARRRHHELSGGDHRVGVRGRAG
jgi:hypothetical protein